MNVEMNQRNKGNDRSGNKRRVLQGYHQEGKRFIPPLLQLVPMTESNWLEDRVPELIWIALLIHEFGWKDGTEIALSVAKAATKCDPIGKRAFAAASDYVELSDEHRHCIRSTLSEEGILHKASQGLAALIRNYTDFPLAFLSNPGNGQDDASGSTLANLRETIANVSDRQSQAGMYAQATVVYIFFVNDKLKVSSDSGLANFIAIEGYPMTDESLRVAAAVRATVTALLSHDILPNWRNSFWNQGRSLGSCEVR